MHTHHAWDTTAGTWHKTWKHWEASRASQFRTASSEMEISFDRNVEDISYQRWLATLSAKWQRDKNVPTVPDVAFFMS